MRLVVVHSPLNTQKYLTEMHPKHCHYLAMSRSQTSSLSVPSYFIYANVNRYLIRENDICIIDVTISPVFNMLLL